MYIFSADCFSWRQNATMMLQCLSQVKVLGTEMGKKLDSNCKQQWIKVFKSF